MIQPFPQIFSRSVLFTADMFFLRPSWLMQKRKFCSVLLSKPFNCAFLHHKIVVFLELPSQNNFSKNKYKSGIKNAKKRLIIVKKLTSIAKHEMFYSQSVDINKGQQKMKLGGRSLSF